MDSVFLIKVLTHLAYPASIIAICFVLGLLFILFGKNIKAALIMLVGISVYLLTSNPYISRQLVSQLEFKYPQTTIEKTPKADAIVVLGGSVRPPSFPRQYTQMTSTSDRFWHAARLFKANKANKIILLGGNVFSQDGIKPESEYVKESLVRLGIPSKSIITETQSRTTRENSTNSKDLLSQHKVGSILLVTSAMHMPRAIREFENASTTIIPVSSDNLVTHQSDPTIFNWIPNANAFASSTRALHEHYGLLAQKGEKSVKEIFNYLKRPAQHTAAQQASVSHIQN